MIFTENNNNTLYSKIFENKKGELFLGGEDHLLYKSTDKGSTWNFMTLFNNAILTSIAFDTSDNMLVAGWNDILISKDGGINFASVKGNLPDISAQPYSIIASNSKNIWFTAAQYNNGKMYRSFDNGKTWEGIILSNQITSIITYGDLLFTLTQNYVFKSSDYGTTWAKLPSVAGQYLCNFTIDEKTGYYYLTGYTYGSSNYIFISKDTGASWETLFEQNSGQPESFTLCFDKKGNIYAGGKNILISPDNGINWITSIEGFYTSTGKIVSLPDKTIGGKFDGTIFVYKSESNTWERTSGYLFPTSILKAANGKYYCVDDGGRAVYCSSDNGNTWDLNWCSSPGDMIRYSCYSIVMTNNNVMVAIGDWRNLVPIHGYSAYNPEILFSADYGANWSLSKIPSVVSNNDAVNCIVKTKSNLLFAGTNYDGIIRSNDEGKNWISVNNNLPQSAGFKFIGILSTGEIFTVSSISEIFYSATDGASWLQVPKWDDVTEITSMVITKYDIIFIATNRGVLYTSNKGNTWHTMNDGLNDLKVKYLMTDQDDYFYAFTASDGAYKTAGQVTAIHAGRETLPEQNQLMQNYPNPFNPATEISYSLKESGYVKLSVFNMLGQKVKELVNAFQEQGIHKVTFDGSSYASGIYFYRLQTNGFTAPKKMLLIK